ncbi:MAG TPA: class I SAM-dependent methyltransferase [Azospirillum sp.]|nr:class I SAM-dependent methyltransferase [Azospirillum sp.]
MKQLALKIRNSLPAPLRSELQIQFESLRLNRLPRTACDPGRLGPAGPVGLGDLFTDPAIAARWHNHGRHVDALPSFPIHAGSMSDIDRRALYFLAHRLAPASVLEVGTHLGASTLLIAAALDDLVAAGRLPSFSVTTVDIRDVNDPVTRPWTAYGSAASPRDLLASIGCADRVEFVTSPSLDFMARTDRRFDLIFLDGSHSAAVVYREVPMALDLLRPGGYVLLHDYHTDFAALRRRGSLCPGPALALRRLMTEAGGFTVQPLGDLPWHCAEHDSHTTTLALLTRSAQA